MMRGREVGKKEKEQIAVLEIHNNIRRTSTPHLLVRRTTTSNDQTAIYIK